MCGLCGFSNVVKSARMMYIWGFPKMVVPNNHTIHVHIFERTHTHTHAQLMWHSDVTFGSCQRCFFCKKTWILRGFPTLLRYWILHCIRVQLRALWFHAWEKRLLEVPIKKNKQDLTHLSFEKFFFFSENMLMLLLSNQPLFSTLNMAGAQTICIQKVHKTNHAIGVWLRDQHTNSHQSWVIKGFSIFSSKEEHLFKCQ